MNNQGLESKPFSQLITDERLRIRISYLVGLAKEKRKETQKEVSKWTGISLTKIKEIEKGTCKDFNSVNDYINYFGISLI